MRSRTLLLVFLTGTLVLSLAGLRQAPAAGPTTGDIAGTVQDGRGAPLANVLVRILSGPARRQMWTDASGQYRLTDLAPGSYAVTASKPGYATRSQDAIEVGINAAPSVDFMLAWADRTTGGAEILVQDRAGRGLSGATVEVTQANQTVGTAATDGAGSAIFPHLAPGAYQANVHRPGYVDLFGRDLRVIAGGLRSVRIAMARKQGETGRLGGQVSDPNGFVANRASVRILSGPSSGQTSSLADGTYDLEGLIPDDAYALQVSASGYATQVVPGLQVQAFQFTQMDVTLIRAVSGKGSLTGTVHDPNGAPVPAATITLAAGPGAGQQVLTDADGLYVFNDLTPSRDYAVRADSLGLAPAGAHSLAVERGQTTRRDLALSFQSLTAGSFAGTVREAGGTRALPNVIVEILDGASAGLATMTDRDGRYQIRGVKPGDGYALAFSRDGYRARSAEDLEVVNGIQTTVDANLAPLADTGGTLAGTVRNGSGAGLEGARVSLTAGPAPAQSVTTDRTGAYTFRSLPPGAGYAVRVQKSGYTGAVRSGIEVQGGQTTQADFTLWKPAQMGSIGGRVFDMSLRPVANARIHVVAGPVTPADVRTGDRGEYLLETLPPGSYTLEVSADGFTTQQRTGVVVASGRKTTATFQLAGSGG